MGPDGGQGGGHVVVCGTPEQVAGSNMGYTSAFLKDELEGQSAETKLKAIPRCTN